MAVDHSSLGDNERRYSPRPRMPLLLSIGFGGFALHGLWTAFFIGSALLNQGVFTENGSVVTGRSFLAGHGAIFIPNGVLSSFIAYALWQEKTWARDLILLWWLAYGAIFVSWQVAASGLQSFQLGPVVNTVVGIAFSGWYLYKKDSVKSYFRAVQGTTSDV